jgi:DNA replication and repair protein RecF
VYLASLCLINFRNYVRQEISFNPGINIISGGNAQGKTSLLEAIYCLATSRSFRTLREGEMVRLGCDYFYLQGAFVLREGRFLAEVGYRQPRQLQIKLNGKLHARSVYLQKHPVVIFSPDDLSLIKEGPSVRRRFLDLEASRLRPLYYSRLRDYYRALRQRNQILKEHRGGPLPHHSLIEPWEQAMAKAGSWIVRERLQLLEDLERLAQGHFARLTGGAEEFSLVYHSSIDLGGGRDLDLMESSFKEQLSQGRAAELRKGATLVGPHLDDFFFLINGLDVRRFGSQGQQRSAVLALKMGEADLFNRTGEEKAILLLDDVFSEFDETRRRHLFQFLSEREDQAFITTAVPLPDFKSYRTEGAAFYTVQGGKIKIG